MTLENRILQRYKSVMSFAKEQNIPYTTMKGIVTRGLGSTSIQTAIQICKALEIEVEACVEGKITPIEDNPNHKHKQLIEKYETLDYFGKKAIDELLEIEYSRCNPEDDEKYCCHTDNKKE